MSEVSGRWVIANYGGGSHGGRRALTVCAGTVHRAGGWHPKWHLHPDTPWHSV